jgi:hypothetical protein
MDLTKSDDKCKYNRKKRDYSDRKKRDYSKIESEDDGYNLKDNIKTKSIMYPSFHQLERKFNYGVEDMLPLFDGTYQAYGAITIATTNNPEVLLEIGSGKTKGALTRAGRLKPYRIGYFDSNTVNQLITIKFGVGHGIQIPDEWYDENNEIKIQSSNFIEILKFATQENLVELLKSDMKIYENIYSN